VEIAFEITGFEEIGFNPRVSKTNRFKLNADKRREGLKKFPLLG
jgi:hypothetical protein